ncbi:hypothetical protein JXA85_06920 [Candidatus Woesearchaeota archaeon]|nr:hypothetical protein [Candidatus Woesearchaeota archaeon]
MGSGEVMIPRDEYELLKSKADLFDHFIEIEELSVEELAQIKNALKGNLLTKAEFLKRYPYLG